MFTWGHDQYGQSNAIWETLYLSGIRPTELLSMKIEDVKTENGITSISVPESKTFPRTIPLPEAPRYLLQYKENHPRRDNKKAWLWFPFKNTTIDKPLQYDNLKNERFSKMIKDLGLKPTLNLKSFRKTRATLIFNSKKLQLIEIAKIMGWTTETVVKRQEEYMLTNNDEIIKKYCTETYTEPTQSQLKDIQSETIKKLTNEIDKLKSIVANRINPYYDPDSPDGYEGTLEWIETPDNKLQLVYTDTETGYIKNFEKPITKEEYEKNEEEYKYQPLGKKLAKFLYENKMTKKINWIDQETRELLD